MPETLNFTQFCIKNGYPCDNDMMFEAQYIGSLGLAGHVSKRTINKLHDNALNNRKQNNEAHTKFIDAILNDEIIDASGEYVKENILKARKQSRIKELREQITIGQGHIKFMLLLGRMAYTSSGKIKIGTQRTINNYQSEIDKAQTELNLIEV
jgi:hypothetical protein